MQKKLLEELKEKLKKEKKALEKELAHFAKKSKKLKGDWTSEYPRFDEGTRLEEAADEVEEYSTRLSVEYSLEKRLLNIDLALEKFKKGKYGICEKCKKNINIERLKAYPGARLCNKCKT